MEAPALSVKSSGKRAAWLAFPGESVINIEGVNPHCCLILVEIDLLYEDRGNTVQY